MTATRRLFDEDPDAVEFEARVISADGYELVLDQTLFFPESGGQPADSGVVNGIEVTHVQEREDQIVHILTAAAPSESTVYGRIDRERRFDHMQQHTGQHILSQAFLERIQGETVGFHLGHEISTIDVAVSEMSAENCTDVEALANRIVFQNKPVYVHKTVPENLHRFPLRKPPKTEGVIRIVEVEGFDFSGCCGTHVQRSGEIGLIKLLRWEKYKNTVRVTFVCGLRALRHYQNAHLTMRRLCLVLSAGEPELGAAAEQLQADRKEQSRVIRNLKEQLIHYEADALLSAAEKSGNAIRIIHCFENRETVELQALVKELVKTAGIITVLCIKSSKPFVIAGRSRDIDWDIRPFLREVCSLINGRGGGSSDLGQAQGDNVQGLESVMALAREAGIS